mmetsp:Transcript_21848/g.67258  ORF Transcript_21848/g.67258 Transcript_21848/m.67258 type:complete len:308 (+) Transcript_21848:2474-3397(+)
MRQDPSRSRHVEYCARARGLSERDVELVPDGKRASLPRVLPASRGEHESARDHQRAHGLVPAAHRSDERRDGLLVRELGHRGLIVDLELREELLAPQPAPLVAAPVRQDQAAVTERQHAGIHALRGGERCYRSDLVARARVDGHHTVEAPRRRAQEEDAAAVELHVTRAVLPAVEQIEERVEHLVRKRFTASEIEELRAVKNLHESILARLVRRVELDPRVPRSPPRAPRQRLEREDRPVAREPEDRGQVALLRERSEEVGGRVRALRLRLGRGGVRRGLGRGVGRGLGRRLNHGGRHGVGGVGRGL